MRRKVLIKCKHEPCLMSENLLSQKKIKNTSRALLDIFQEGSYIFLSSFLNEEIFAQGEDLWIYLVFETDVYGSDRGKNEKNYCLFQYLHIIY